MMYQAPELWHALMDKLVIQVIGYLELQIRSGVDAVQLFDTWVGSLSISDFVTYVKPHTQKLLNALKGQVPVIYFGTGNGHQLAEVATMGADVLALDWRVPLADTWQQLNLPAVQGNLDPIILCSDQATIAEQAARVLQEGSVRPGHIFNLGHGIIPETPVDNVKFLVDQVQAYARPQA
ncbi:UNVERIFIED_CONTAM: hypothetical protein GTU68_043454 [Idotea baltica]|nr:hypothetical protein [Idotea baltica]